MTRVDSAVLEIKEMIMSNQYNQDGYLPSEGELSERLEVSRATIREAVRTLEVRGFVKRVHGKGILVINNGVKVLTQSMHDMFELEELEDEDVLEVRWILETKAAEKAADLITQEELDELHDLIEKMEEFDEIGDEYLNIDHQFHRKLAQCSRNKMLSVIVNAYSGLLDKVIKTSTNTKNNLEREYHYHRNIYDAVAEGNAKKAKLMMENHLKAAHRNRGGVQ